MDINYFEQAVCKGKSWFPPEFLIDGKLRYFFKIKIHFMDAGYTFALLPTIILNIDCCQQC